MLAIATLTDGIVRAAISSAPFSPPSLLPISPIQARDERLHIAQILEIAPDAPPGFKALCSDWKRWLSSNRKVRLERIFAGDSCRESETGWTRRHSRVRHRQLFAEILAPAVRAQAIYCDGLSQGRGP